MVYPPHALLTTVSTMTRASFVREVLGAQPVSMIALRDGFNAGRLFDAYRIQGVVSYSLAQDLPHWQTAGLLLGGGLLGAIFVVLLSRHAECAQCEEASQGTPSSQKSGKDTEPETSSTSASEASSISAVPDKPLSQSANSFMWTACMVVMMSIPALLGSCCWPLLAAGMLGMAQLSTSGTRAVAHAFMFGLHFGIFAALIPKLVVRTSEERKHIASPQIWAPLCLCVIGAAFVMLDLTRHMLLDFGIGIEYLPMYQDDGNLTQVGKAGVLCTWVGMVALIVGVAWLIDLPSKMRKRWQAASGEHEPLVSEQKAK